MNLNFQNISQINGTNEKINFNFYGWIRFLNFDTICIENFI